MKPLIQLTLAAAGLLILASIGWNVIQATGADTLAARNPDAVLRSIPSHPQAALASARRALAKGEYDKADELARRLLQVAPGQGRAFGLVALAAAERRQPGAKRLLEIASTRSRRDRGVRAAAGAAAFEAGDLETGMAQVDALLRVGSGNDGQIYVALSKQSEDPRFAEVLVDTISRKPSPRWRRNFLAKLGGNGSAKAVDNVYAGLQSRDELSMTDTRHWLDRMMHDGRWGEAYAHWIGTLDDMAAGIPALHNGDFESPLEDLGFGWRRERISGVFFQLEDDPSGTAGRVAHLHFLGRSTATAGLAHPLLLAPGRYRMSFRARSEYLRSEQGLVWQVACAANDGPPLGGVGTLVDGDGWRDLSVTFDVPDVGCTAQWLRLTNPAPKGTAQQVSGDLWVDDFSITSLDFGTMPPKGER